MESRGHELSVNQRESKGNQMHMEVKGKQMENIRNITGIQGNHTEIKIRWKSSEIIGSQPEIKIKWKSKETKGNQNEIKSTWKSKGRKRKTIKAKWESQGTKRKSKAHTWKSTEITGS